MEISFRPRSQQCHNLGRKFIRKNRKWCQGSQKDTSPWWEQVFPRPRSATHPLWGRGSRVSGRKPTCAHSAPLAPGSLSLSKSCRRKFLSLISISSSFWPRHTKELLIVVFQTLESSLFTRIILLWQGVSPCSHFSFVGLGGSEWVSPLAFLAPLPAASTNVTAHACAFPLNPACSGQGCNRQGSLGHCRTFWSNCDLEHYPDLAITANTGVTESEESLENHFVDRSPFLLFCLHT